MGDRCPAEDGQVPRDRRALLGAARHQRKPRPPRRPLPRPGTRAYLSNEVLATIKADKALASGDVNRVQKLIDEKILPYVDFQKMTQLAVGADAPGHTRAARRADARVPHLARPDLQRRVVAGDDHQVQLRPFRAQPADTDVLCAPASWRHAATDPARLPLEKQTRAGRSTTSTSSRVAGRELQDAVRLADQRRGVDGLIKTLTDRNRQLEQGKKA